jgi:hypothetical protein
MARRPRTLPEADVGRQLSWSERESSAQRQSWRGDHVPFLKLTSAGSRTPACHCTTAGAVGWRCLMAASSSPRMLTCTGVGLHKHGMLCGMLFTSSTGSRPSHSTVPKEECQLQVETIDTDQTELFVLVVVSGAERQLTTQGM